MKKLLVLAMMVTLYSLLFGQTAFAVSYNNGKNGGNNHGYFWQSNGNHGNGNNGNHGNGNHGNHHGTGNIVAPEPISATLFLLGGAGLMIRRRIVKK